MFASQERNKEQRKDNLKSHSQPTYSNQKERKMVCMCVCVDKRERERETEQILIFKQAHWCMDSIRLGRYHPFARACRAG